MPKPYYKTTGPVEILQARCIFCILNSNLLLRNQQMCYN